MLVLLAARLLWDKGIGEFIAAARMLKAQGRSIRFLLAGTPDPGNPASIDEAQVRVSLPQALAMSVVVCSLCVLAYRESREHHVVIDEAVG